MVMLSVRLCVGCPREARHQCFCRWPPAPVCQECVRKHTAEVEGNHAYVSLPPTFFPNDIQSYLQAQHHLSEIQALKSSIGLTIEDLRECIAAIKRCAALIIREVTDYRDHQIATMEALITELKKDCGKACREIEENLINENYEGISKWARMAIMGLAEHRSLLTWTEGKREELNLEDAFRVTYQLELPPSQITPPPEIRDHRETINPSAFAHVLHQGPSIALLSLARLSVFSPVVHSWSHFALDSTVAQLSESSLFVLQAEGGWVVVQGISYYSPVSHIAVLTPSLQLSTHITLNTPRFSLGAIVMSDILYALGGANVSRELLASTERIPLEPFPGSSQSYSDMIVPRRAFAPCAHGQLLFVCGGFDTSSVEVIDTVSGAVSLLAFSLPDVSDTLTVAISETSLLVVTKSHFVTVDIKTGRQIEVWNHWQWGIMGAGGVVVGGKVYSAAMGVVNEIDWEKGEIRRIGYEGAEAQ